ncbi:MAG: sigma-54-dependent Fis family transcriptional regulator [Lentisphaeria bacterium]|nr:sigma-54-dependent Fis family transcriptional regulator [Lentisphaeria bacterium]
MNILIVDDEANIRKTLSLWLRSHGHQVLQAGSAAAAREENGANKFDLLFLDLRLGADDGLALIPALLADSPWLKIIVMTAYSSIDTAVQAMKLGAFDYIAKPFTPGQIELVIGKAEQVLALESRISALSEDLKGLHPDAVFTSRNPKMQRLLEMARQVAASEAAVLLRGESGTGKTVLARAIHGWSPRAAFPFGTVSCPTLTPELLSSELFGHVRGSFTGAVRDNPGRIAACDRGTLFLDEIGDLPPAIQPQLLRFIQDHEYERIGDPVTRRADVRLVAATNRNLEEAVKEGSFREDLFYRLNVFELEIPPLRERAEDIGPLAGDMLLFFAHANRKVLTGFSEEALDAMRAYAWPGNLRELRNAVERGAILASGGTVELAHLPGTLRGRSAEPRFSGRPTLAQMEEEYIRHVLAAAGSLQEAAEILGVNQATLWRKRKSYGI